MKADAVSPDRAALRDAAAGSLDLAARYCADACRAYHAVWPFLRLYGVLPAVGRDHDALLEALNERAEAGDRRVLVSGSADFGILAYVIAAFDARGRQAEVTVVDLCPTPLAACRWYAERRGWTIATEAVDIKEFRGRDFDLVAAHNFLNFFDPEARRSVVRGWRDALRTGGHALVFANLKEGAPALARRFGDDGTERLVSRTLGAWRESPDRDLIDAGTLEDLVRSYARERHSHNLRSIEELCEPFVAAGLEIERLDRTAITAAGTTTDWVGHRHRLLARRPPG